MNNVDNIAAACFRRRSQMINFNLMEGPEGTCSVSFLLRRQQLQESFTVAQQWPVCCSTEVTSSWRMSRLPLPRQTPTAPTRTIQFVDLCPTDPKFDMPLAPANGDLARVDCIVTSLMLQHSNLFL